MKTADLLTIIVGLAAVAGAVWIFTRSAAAAPPAGQLYHPVTNPNGYTFTPVGGNGGGQWSRVSTSGKVEYWADVL